MKEYKQYISSKIDNIPKSASTGMTSISITISEEGFAAMKNDPEYEKWVLDGLKKNWKFNNPWTAILGGGFEVHFFGATKEEYSGQSWGPGYQQGNGAELFTRKSANSFWLQRSGNSEAASAMEKQKWQQRNTDFGSSRNSKRWIWETALSEYQWV